MTKFFLSTVAFFAFSTAWANGFCEPQAIAAAKALANVNGSVNKTAEAGSDAGRLYVVTLSDRSLKAEDYYMVETSGDHDCIVYSVKVNGSPTRYP